MKKEAFSKQSIDLCNKALFVAKDSLNAMRYRDTEYIIKALSILDTSIMLDSSYYLAYGYKAHFYLALNDRNNAIKSLKVICNRKINYAEGYTTIGIIFDAMNQKDSANYYYQKSIEAAYNRINKKQFDEKDELVNIAFTQFLIDGDKEKAIKIIKKLDEQNKPKKYFIIADGIENYNREDFLKDY